MPSAAQFLGDTGGSTQAQPAKRSAADFLGTPSAASPPPTQQTMTQSDALVAPPDFANPAAQQQIYRPRAPSPVPQQDVQPYEEAVSALKPEQVQKAREQGIHLDLQKPEYRTLPFKTQTAYDLASNDVERTRVLRDAYGADAVGRDFRGLYVRLDGGRKVYPQSGVASTLAAGAAPTAGAVIGGLGGEALGGPAGGIAGSAAGSAAGRGVNDAIMKSLGFYDRSAGEEALGLAGEAAGGAVGEGAGRLVGAAPGGALGLASRGIGKVASIDPEAAAKALELAERGYHVAPGSYAPGLPVAQRHVEMARRFGYDPTKAGAQRFTEEEATGALERSGLAPEAARAETERLKSVATPSLEEPGQQLQEAARADVRQSAESVRQQSEAIRSQAKAEGEAAVGRHQASVAETGRRVDQLQQRLQGEIDAGFRQIDQRRAASGRPGNIAQDLGRRLTEYRQQLTGRANQLYDAWKGSAAGKVVNVSGLKDAANNFMSNLPEDLKAAYPALIRQIGELDQGGMSVVELHRLRTQLRDLAGDTRLTPNFRKGPYAYMAGVVDDTMHDTAATPGLKPIIRQLDKIDSWYAKNFRVLQNKTLQSVVDEAKDGLFPDPAAVIKQIVEPGESATLKKLFQLGGPKIRARVQTADLDQMLQNATRLDGKVDAKQFAAQVANRQKNGTLTLVHGNQASDLVTLAQRLSARVGDLPLQDLTPDNFIRNLKLLNKASDELERLTKQDPMKFVAGIDKDADRQVQELLKSFRAKYGANADILGFLRNPNVLAEHAADRVLQSEQTLRAVIDRFGTSNPQVIDLLRQKALERLLAPVLRGQGGESLIQPLSKMTPGAQKLLFPNGLDQDLVEIARGLEVMQGRGTGSIPGFATGETLDSPILGGGSNLFSQLYHGRYGKMAVTEGLAWLVTHPRFVKTLASGFRQGGAEATKSAGAFRSIMAHLSGAAGQAGGGAIGGPNEGTPEGQQELPPIDPAAGQGANNQWQRYVR